MPAPARRNQSSIDDATSFDVYRARDGLRRFANSARTALLIPFRRWRSWTGEVRYLGGRHKRIRGQTPKEIEMDGRQFDTLAKSLAGVSNRRSFLKFVAGSAGSLIGAAGIRGAMAGNADCAAFCKTIFGPGLAQGDCISAAAHGEGLCIECGGDPASACAGPDGSVTCDCEATCTPDDLRRCRRGMRLDP